jgi:hypothetical protein
MSSSRGVFFCSLFMILEMMALGCGPASMAPVTATSPVKGLIVNVREFDASRADVKDYSEPVQPYGLQTAEAIVEALQEAGITAQIAPPGATPNGHVIVEGSVTMVEGGSTTSRVLLGGFGPVGATRFGVAYDGTECCLVSLPLIVSLGWTCGGRVLTDSFHAQRELSASTLLI